MKRGGSSQVSFTHYQVRQLFYSGHEDECAPHTEDVAIMLSKEVQQALISWEVVSLRIVSARFTTKKKNINITVIQCYAPTNDALDGKKEEFYDQLRVYSIDKTIRILPYSWKIGDSHCDGFGYPERDSRDGDFVSII